MASIEDTLNSYPRVSLTRLPTPLHPLPHLSDRLGLSVFIKRDDLTDLVFGGDKPRKLEPDEECEHDMLVLIQWKRRQFAVPLMQLEGTQVDEETQQALEDWHYWVNRGYAF